MYENLLKGLGLSANEALVYEILLQNGPLAVKAILPKTDLRRSNLYNVLTSLKAHELIIERPGKNGVAVFYPETPEKLEDLFARQEDRLKQLRHSLADDVPAMKNLFKLKQERPVVRYYEGVDGFKKIYEETLAVPGAEVRVWVSKFGDVALDNYIKTYVKKRAELNIHTKILSGKTIGSDLIAQDKELKKDRRFLPDTLPTEIDVFGDRVAFLSFRHNLIGVVIENADLADTMRKIFDSLWSKLPEVKK